MSVGPLNCHYAGVVYFLREISDPTGSGHFFCLCNSRFSLLNFFSLQLILLSFFPHSYLPLLLFRFPYVLPMAPLTPQHHSYYLVFTSIVQRVLFTYNASKSSIKCMMLVPPYLCRYQHGTIAQKS
jgi:hypothetical protein